MSDKVYITPESLDELAEAILIAAADTRNAAGLRVASPMRTSDAPQAVILALNQIFGIDCWMCTEEWPRREQWGVERVAFPFGRGDEPPKDK